MTTAPTTAARFALVEGLLRRATALDAKYLLKLMLADMRIGVKQALIEEAIAIAASAELTALRNAVMLEADLAHATARAFAGTLAEARMALFHPLGFMLASPVDTPEEAVERFSQPDQPGIHAYLEDKYDGMRCQLHCGSQAHPGRVALYSRNREDITHSFPEIAEAFAHITEPIILDGELLGWDFAADQALPFSILGQRIGRKKVTNDLRRSIPVLFMAFDLLYEQSELLLPLPLSERRARLESLAARLAPTTVSPLEVDPHATAAQSHLFAVASTEPAIPRLRLSPAIMVDSAQAIDEAYAAARARANEGVMLKSASSVYQPGRRGLSWVKLKRELATLDVVITGAEFGHGRRAGLLSDYTFAVRGPASPENPAGDLLNVGKAYSGVTDAEIAELTAWLQAHTLEDHGHFRTVEPLRVLEVAFNNVMRSDRHASGFALRFPRIIRIRDDKPVAEIDTLARVEEIYHSQPDKA
jgi:DNA ligase-1